jgi:zinc protease
MFAILFTFAALAFGQETQVHFDVESYKLPNGLTVILSEDHSIPEFTYQQWFKVGSAYEQLGHTGLAHFFEHMMFKGTTKYPGKKYLDLVESNGGTFNAETSQDYTFFFASLPSNKLELIVDLESDRMRNLKLDVNDVKSEREVVKEERRMRTENEVFGLLEEAVFKTVFKVHSYGWPIIGSMVDLDAASIEDMRAFYNTYYAPNNAIVTIVGDFEKSQAKSLIQKYYGGIKPQLIPAPTITVEPEQKSPRSLVVSKPVQNPTLAVTFPGTRSGEPDSYALDLLANILGEGNSSRLYKKFVYKQQVATAVYCSSWTPRFNGLFEILFSLKSGQAANVIAGSVMQDLKDVRDKDVSDLELSKAKNQITKSYVDLLKTNSGRAHALSINQLILGDYRRLFTDLDHYRAVTKEQVRDVAVRYLNPNKKTVVSVSSEAKGVSR